MGAVFQSFKRILRPLHLTLPSPVFLLSDPLSLPLLTLPEGSRRYHFWYPFSRIFSRSVVAQGVLDTPKAHNNSHLLHPALRASIGQSFSWEFCCPHNTSGITYSTTVYLEDLVLSRIKTPRTAINPLAISDIVWPHRRGNSDPVDTGNRKRIVVKLSTTICLI